MVYFIFAMVEYSSSENYTARVFLLVIFTISCGFLPLFDTLPCDIRIVCSKLGIPACIILIIVWEIALFLNWSDCPSKRINFFGHLDITVSGQTSSAMNNILLLLVLFCASAYLHPQNLVIIKSPTEILTMTQEQSRKLRTLATASHDIADKHRKPDIVQVFLSKIISLKFENKE